MDEQGQAEWPGDGYLNPQLLLTSTPTPPQFNLDSPFLPPRPFHFRPLPAVLKHHSSPSQRFTGSMVASTGAALGRCGKFLRLTSLSKAN